jgi:hypothetical protein
VVVAIRPAGLVQERVDRVAGDLELAVGPRVVERDGQLWSVSTSPGTV